MKIFYEPVRLSKFGIARVSVSIGSAKTTFKLFFRRIDHFITEGLQSACFYAEGFPYSNVGAKSRNDSENQ